ncbi:hypothetical protein BK816_04120 [Boudabousia tangfeifanii]|uniref:PKD domain-containing protein n=2 Tax=Boudabousia tangfeifanii TaxID=1912795 RepID=A0A1D9MK85_9ACTO|nr:hypothetical protein BK816_04120 [Boudabousia tangfeifanii]
MENAYRQGRQRALERRAFYELKSEVVSGKNCTDLYHLLYPKTTANRSSLPAFSPPAVYRVNTALLKEKVANASKAHMVIEPDGRHITSKDAIISATSDKQTIKVNLDGHNITVNLKAVKFIADFGDGGPKLVQSSLPKPWPEGLKGKFHRKYRKEGKYTAVLTTKWEGTYTDPTSGSVKPLPGLVTTSEKSKIQTVKNYKYQLTDDAEEANGH